ncbi:MAG: CDP-glycerol glycerophosphotransferase family protein [Clostridia bacterium]|nr:CDP-glycerol glycerophosphotransferase family protein [Clostridia bacterium]
MIRKIKRKIKNIVKRVLFGGGGFSKTILFESAPDFSDNTKAVFDEMIRRGLNKRYQMIWKTSSPEAKLEQSIENVFYIDTSTKRGRRTLTKTLYQAKCLISCNMFLAGQRKGQTAFYLSHGIPIKSVRGYYTVPTGIDYCLATSQDAVDLMAYELKFPREKVLPLGYPRNDVFSQEKINVRKYLNATSEKVIVWYPTFRQHKGGGNIASGNALPIIHDMEKAKKLNECAKENNVLLVLKPHFAQNLSYIKNLNLSNIRFIDDNFFVENKISSYQFVGGCDALITDYSSIYYDFTLCDKPIAAIWEDIEEYKVNPGLIKDYEFYMKGAEKIYNLEEFIGFISNVAKGIDLLKKERNEIKNLINCSTDGKNSERVVDFIIEKAGL